MIEFSCEFEQYEPRQVECRHCGHKLTGIPEDYANRRVCPNLGPGFDLFEKINRWAERFKLPVKNCGNCARVRLIMNERGKDWCRENKDWLIAALKANAKSQGLPVPEMLIRVFLKSVIK